MKRDDKLWKKFNSKLNRLREENSKAEIVSTAVSKLIPLEDAKLYSDWKTISNYETTGHIMALFDALAFQADPSYYNEYGFQATSRLNGCTQKFLRANLVKKNPDQSEAEAEEKDPSLDDNSMDLVGSSLKPIAVLHPVASDIENFSFKIFTDFLKRATAKLEKTLGRPLTDIEKSTCIVENRVGAETTVATPITETGEYYYVKLYRNDENGSAAVYNYKVLILEIGKKIPINNETICERYGLWLRPTDGGRSAIYFLDGSLGRGAGLSASQVTFIEELTTAMCFEKHEVGNLDSLKDIVLTECQRLGKKFTETQVMDVLQAWYPAIQSVLKALNPENFKKTGAAWTDLENFDTNFNKLKGYHPKQLKKFTVDALTDPTDIVLIADGWEQKYETKFAKPKNVINDILSLKRIGVSLKKPEDEEAVVHYIGDLSIKSTPAVHYCSNGESNSIEYIGVYVPKDISSSSANICLQLNDTLYSQLNLPRTNKAKKITLNIRTFTTSASCVSAEVVGWKNARGGKFGGLELLKLLFGDNLEIERRKWLKIHGDLPIDMTKGTDIVATYLGMQGFSQGIEHGKQVDIWKKGDANYNYPFIKTISLLLAKALKVPCIDDDKIGMTSENLVIPYLKVN